MLISELKSLRDNLQLLSHFVQQSKFLVENNVT